MPVRNFSFVFLIWMVVTTPAAHAWLLDCGTSMMIPDAVGLPGLPDSHFAELEKRTRVKLVESPSLKLLGGSIVNQDTQEALAIACVGLPAENPSCSCLRNVYISRDKSFALYFGGTRYVDESFIHDDTVDLKKYLHESYQHQQKQVGDGLGGPFNLFVPEEASIRALPANTLKQRDGWNWSSKTRTLTGTRFEKSLQKLEYYFGPGIEMTYANGVTGYDRLSLYRNLQLKK
jgi:hypothetical protein